MSDGVAAREMKKCVLFGGLRPDFAWAIMRLASVISSDCDGLNEFVGALRGGEEVTGW